MKNALKAEFRKLLSVRSTYIATGFIFLFIIFMCFYIEAFRLSDAASLTANKLTTLVFNIPGLVGQVGFIVVALLMIHEYRYNTITYTLTASNSRTRVLLAKILTTVTYAVFVTIAGMILGLVSYRIGLAMAGHTLPPQDFNVAYIFARSIFYASGYMLFGLIVATLVRNIAFAVAVMFIAPATIEPLIGLLLKTKAVYLPFSLLAQQIMTPGQDSFTQGSTSPGRSALFFSVYLIVGWVVTWYLFLRRDAN